MNPSDGDGLHGTRSARVGVKNREERLIEILTVTAEGLPQDALLHGADLQQRAGAATIQNRRPRLEPTRADRLEHEIEDQFRAFFEDSRAPER